jgi:hypothetical protein
MTESVGLRTLLGSSHPQLRRARPGPRAPAVVRPGRHDRRAPAGDESSHYPAIMIGLAQQGRQHLGSLGCIGAFRSNSVQLTHCVRAMRNDRRVPIDPRDPRCCCYGVVANTAPREPLMT